MRTLPDSTKLKLPGIVSVCILSVALLSGCGRKVFPKPEGAPPVPRVSDLAARVTARSVELQWTPAAQAGPVSYGVMKSDLSWKKRDCLQCPAPSRRMVWSIEAAAALPGPDGKLRWVDRDVSYYRAYRYRIAVIGQNGLPLSLSNPVIAKVYPGPATPVAVSALAQPHGILIRWKPVLKDAEGKRISAASISFRVERLHGKKGWAKASSTFVKGDVYFDRRIVPGRTYSYRVIPVRFIDDVYIYGTPSSIVRVKGPPSVPPPPPRRVWVTPGRGGLEIFWTENRVQTAGYQVYRREGKRIVRLTASPVKRPPFVDRSARKGAAYFYAVSAVSALPGHKEGLLSRWVKVRNLLTE